MMNYLLFNNEILISDGTQVRRIGKADDLAGILAPIERVNICVVDSDVLIAPAVESPIEKKDSLLVRKFTELYQHESYIIQDERIDKNLFQVIGIKEQKVREIYSLIPPEKVEFFIPYGIALRNTLINYQIDLNKGVVFVDDQGRERLLTVFDGLKFSRTRIITNNGEDILPEIKRSQIDFSKKNEEYLSKQKLDFMIIVNNQSLYAEILKTEKKLPVELLNVAYPALEGLKNAQTSIKYKLAEENILKRRAEELRNKVRAGGISSVVISAGLFYFLFNRFELDGLNNRYESSIQIHAQLEKQIHRLDAETYRQDLKRQKSLNFGIAYLAILKIIPASYAVDSFRFYKTNQWNIEMRLLADESGVIDPIPRRKLLKNVAIKDIFVNGQPGKLFKITL